MSVITVFSVINVSALHKKYFYNEHHLGAGTSPFLGIPDFDPVKSIFLDSMHLLYLGIMKWIMHQLLGTKKINKKCKLPVQDTY